MLTEDEDRRWSEDARVGDLRPGWKAAGGAGRAHLAPGTIAASASSLPCPCQPSRSRSPQPARSRRKTEIYPTFEQQLTTRIGFLNFDIAIVMMNTDTLIYI